MRIICISNQKGGVAKTTTTYCLGASLSRRGNKVLLIDLDPQAALSLLCKLSKTVSPSIFDVMDPESDITVPDAVVHHDLFDIVPASLQLSRSERQFTEIGREKLLKRALQKIDGTYDFVIIDTPPSLGILTINALTACNDLIIPSTAEILPLTSITTLNDLVVQIREETNPQIHVMGILLTMFNPRTKVSSVMLQLVDQMSETIEAPRFQTTIRNTVKIGESQAYRTDPHDYAKSATATRDYEAFCDEYLRRIQNE